MNGPSASGNGASRLDRVEKLLQKLPDDHFEFFEEHKLLLRAQVVLTEKVDKLAEKVDKLAEAGQHTDERLNALISVVDGLVRRPPPSAPQT